MLAVEHISRPTPEWHFTEGGERDRHTHRVLQRVSYLCFLAMFTDPVLNKIDEAVLLLYLLWRERRWKELDDNRSHHRHWTHPLMFRQFSLGYLVNMFAEPGNYPPKFHNFTRISVDTCD